MRVAVVVQRFGADLLGGAETHAALMADILGREHAVEVLTTTAREYHEWRNSYPPGACEVGGTRVRRFPVERGREPGWHVLSRLLHDGFEASGFCRLPAEMRAAFASRVRAWPDALQERFIRGQGPIAPALTAYLRDEPFDRVLFVTYLYPTTYDGLAVVPPGRARVVPTLHDEPPAYLPVFGRRLARAELLCSTQAEVALVSRLYPDRPPRARVIGYGIELPPDPAPGEELADGVRENDNFILYAGRVDVQKGVADLLGWYAALRRALANPPRLVLIGAPAMPLPRLAGLEARGVVSEAEKIALMRRALALVHPSPYESLGIVLLEAMACRTPVVVRAECEVMVEHCRRGGGGVWVRDAADFAAAVERLRSSPELRSRLGRSGRAYVEAEYSREAYARRLLAEFSPGGSRA